MRRSNKNRSHISGLVVEEPKREERNGTLALHVVVRERHFTMRRGEEVEYFNFLEIDAYGRPAEEAAEWVRKGSVIEVKGRLESRGFPVLVDGKEIQDSNNETVTCPRVSVVARKITSLSRRERAAGEGADDSSTATPKPPATPGAEELARREGIALGAIEGNGRLVGGVATVTKADVERAAKATS
jgi:single-stranded DNA-binding protein